MPKVDIDYSNTIIYKIYCKDHNITDTYVGHTTNFVQRKYAHKQQSDNINNMCKLYVFIRNNGGWVNWKMEIVAFYECNNHYEARIREQEFFISLNATLNSIEPMPPKNSIVKSNIIVESTQPTNTFIESNIIVESTPPTNTFIESNIVESTPNENTNVCNTHKFLCKCCGIKTNNKKDYTNHLLTLKHIKKDSILTPINNNNIPVFMCNCGKIYKYSQGLSKHKIGCIYAKKSIIIPDALHGLRCKCGDIFNNRVTLWRHTKNCNKSIDDIIIPSIELPQIDNNFINEHIPDNDVICKLLKSLIDTNNDFKKLILDQHTKIVELTGIKHNCYNNDV